VRPLVALLACCAALACGGARDDTDVVLITLDTTRADHLGPYGYDRPTTPNLDRFAERAVTYERAWATGAWTLPTHASMVTGRYPAGHGARFDAAAADVSLSQVLEGEFFTKHKARRLPEEEVTLAELLLERGYATAAFAGGPWLAPPFGLMQGYEHRDTEVTQVEGRSAEELTDGAIAWLESVPAGRPVHLLVNYFDPHTPYDPPPGYDDMPGARIRLRERQDEIFVNGGARLEPRQRFARIGRYDGEIRYMDHHLGRLFRALERLGRFDDALVIVVADHGELFGEHGVMGHGRWLYEEVLRIPLIVRFPGGRGGGSRDDRPVSQVDLLPLVAGELDLALPREIDGVPPGQRDSLLAEAYRDPFSLEAYGDRYDRDLVAMVRWPWKLITSDVPERLAFDLERDPGETQALSDDEVETALLEQLAAALEQRKVRTRTVPAEGVDEALEENLRALGYIE
jgi:arylsulfatase A-like enzyme